MYVKKLKVPLYYSNLILIDAESWDEASKTFKSLSDPDGTNNRLDTYATTCAGWITERGIKWKAILVVLNTKNPHLDLDIGTLAHEAVHVKNMIFERIGHSPDLNNDEPEAYLVGWITEQLHRFVESNKKKNNETNSKALETG